MIESMYQITAKLIKLEATSNRIGLKSDRVTCRNQLVQKKYQF